MTRIIQNWTIDYDIQNWMIIAYHDKIPHMDDYRWSIIIHFWNLTIPDTGIIHNWVFEWMGQFVRLSD